MSPTESWGSKMMGSNPQKNLCSSKCEYHLLKLWIFSKYFERFPIYSNIKNWPFWMIKSDHKIETLLGSPQQKVWGPKWWARTHKTFYAARNVKIIYKNCGFFQNILRDFLFIQISKTDHLEWSKAIIKLKPFWEAPDKKLVVKNDGHRPTNVLRGQKWENHF